MEDINPEELKNRIDNKENLNIIDVREVWEYESANIGAKNIPLGDLPSALSQIEHLKSEEIIIHCKSGYRSAKAKRFLETQGFTKVRNLLKGIDGFLAIA